MQVMSHGDAASEMKVLVGAAEAALDTRELAEVRMLLDAGECGVALEHLASYLMRGKVPITADTLERLQRTAKSLGLQDDEAVAALRRQRPEAVALTRSLHSPD
jgi:hypothetical protein